MTSNKTEVIRLDQRFVPEEVYLVPVSSLFTEGSTVVQELLGECDWFTWGTNNHSLIDAGRLLNYFLDTESDASEALDEAIRLLGNLIKFHESTGTLIYVDLET